MTTKKAQTTKTAGKTVKAAAIAHTGEAAYSGVHGDIVALLEAARSTAARSVNALMTASYWEIGRRIVEFEQGGKERAEYGEALIRRLAVDLSARFGRGFGLRNLHQMQQFYLAWRPEKIVQTPSALSTPNPTVQTSSGKSVATQISETSSRKFSLAELAKAFPLPWSAYVRLLSVKNPQAQRHKELES